MASKWRIFWKPIIAREDMVNAITKTTIILHNFIKNSEKNAGNTLQFKPIISIRLLHWIVFYRCSLLL